MLALQVRAFKGVLLRAGRVATVRVSKGDDEMAACGQLGDPGEGECRGLGHKVQTGVPALLGGTAG
jgi:hypothetical protein